MKKWSILFFLIFIIFSFTNGQSFEGKLVYVYQDVYLDSTIKAKSTQLLGDNFFEEDQNSISTYWIKGSNLIWEEKKSSGMVSNRGIQNEKEAYLLTNTNRKIDYTRLTMEYLEDIKPVQKSKEFKEIHGYRCRKYEYILNEGATQVIAWIAEGIPFDKHHQRDRFFQYFFLPDGLALEKRLIHATAEQLWTLQSIEIGNIPDEIFELKN